MRSEVMTILGEHGKTISDLADAMGVNQSTLSRILNGKLRLTADMALRLDKAIGRGARHWLAIQMERDIATATRKGGLESVRKLVDNRADI